MQDGVKKANKRGYWSFNGYYCTYDAHQSNDILHALMSHDKLEVYMKMLRHHYDVRVSAENPWGLTKLLIMCTVCLFDFSVSATLKQTESCTEYYSSLTRYWICYSPQGY